MASGFGRSPSRRDVLRGAVGAGAVALAARGGGPGSARAAEGPPPILEPVRYSLRLTEETSAPVGPPQAVTLAGGTLPGTEIRFRAGFLLRVEVSNGLAQPTALHWHGLPVPNAMDGEPGVTQLPIAPGAVTTYEFPATAPGTHWYRSTVGFQRQLGLCGPLVIEDRDDPWSVQRDLVVFLSDWMVGDPAEVRPMPAGRAPQAAAGERARYVHPSPDGKRFATDVQFSSFLMNGRGHRNAWTCQAQPGERVRLRVVNGSAQTFFRFGVAGHRLRVVAADGHDVVPVEVDDLVLGTGERYDVVVEVGTSGAWPIRAAALGQSGGAVGVLHTPDVKPAVSTARPHWEGTTLGYDMLRARVPAEPSSGPRRNLRVSIREDTEEYRFAVNGVTFPADPSTADGFDPIPIQPGEVVRLEMHNKTVLSQSLHLHGHVFRLLGDDAKPAEAPRKDTVRVDPGERVRIEFAADNPGRWLLEGVGLYRRRAGLARVIAYVEGTATV